VLGYCVVKKSDKCGEDKVDWICQNIKNTLFHHQFSLIVVQNSLPTYISCYVEVATCLHASMSRETVAVVIEAAFMKACIIIVIYMSLTL
jgi:hypothetical protein